MKDRFSEKLFKTIGQVADEDDIKVYVVGGYVRDALLGKSSKDLDFVVVGDGPSFAKKVARRLNASQVAIYKKFGTAMIVYHNQVLEFVGARAESYRGDSRKPTVQSADLMADLSRRDFTINAMAVSLNNANFGEIVDPYHGQTDLQNKIIRTPLKPEKTFFDDPLRIMRAIRFACQLQFEMDKTTKAGLQKEATRLKIISQERITDELMKILASQKPSIGFHLMDETGVLELILPEIAAMKGVEEINGYRHKDVLYHTLKVIDNVAAVSSDIRLRFLALYHDVAKPPTKQFKPGIGWTFHGHDDLGARMMKGIGRRLRISNELLHYTQKMIRLHLRPIHLAEEGVTDSAIRRLLFLAGDDVDDLMTFCRADITSGNPKRVAKHLANFDYVVERMLEVEEKDRLRQFQPPVRGDEIMQTYGLPPGPLVGKIKKAIEEAILEGTIPNEHDAAFEFMLKIKDDILAAGG